MEKFWAVILIFAIVAAGGLLYVNQVYAPQKDTQAAMAETANQTLSAVKTEMDNDTTPSVVTAQAVIQTVKLFCNSASNTVEIVVDADTEGSGTYKNNSDGIEVLVGSITKHFLKTPKCDGAGVLESIRFEVLDN